MLQIRKAILHIVDVSNELTINSMKLLDLSKDGVLEYLSKHIGKSLRDNSVVESNLGDDSPFAKLWNEYSQGKIEFIDLSVEVCNIYSQEFFKTKITQNIDFVFCEFIKDNTSYIGFLLLANNTYYTHQVIQADGIISNNLLKFYAVLPSILQKIEGFAFFNMDSKKVSYLEKKNFMNEQGRLIISEIIFECPKDMSSKEALKIVKNVVSEIAEVTGKNSSVAIAKARIYLSDNAEVSEKVDTESLSHAIFPDSEECVETFKKEIKERGVSSIIHVRPEFALREGRKHKIKTDTGVELIVPTEFFNNRDYIEFNNNVDGTISISIKNIGKIINK